ncbi:glycosyltransferase [Phaeocystidibacter luteus]|uniref:Glycosyltransferase n=1 Tax=Phaeocystidibacter luteus TaxID=911197 RepID=A0A6N6RGA8_9FLAO|nr:glycosyltransferase [Phaeocystidibacter luteus]KAB2809778.1 glycosyltransferase [Phaeocystidibacter luteus]
MSTRVAFIQNRVQRGGRFQVTVEMLKVFNAMGITPDFYCYRTRITQDQIKEAYGADVKVNFIEINEPLSPFEWNIVLFNSQINRRVAGYDLIVNSNNTSFGLSRGLNIISYVHFPRKYRMRSSDRSIHFPGRRKSLFDFANDPFKFFSWLYRFDKRLSDKDYQICNSQFTADALKSMYNREADAIIYPPVDVEIESRQKEARSIVSLGRFSPDKRQLEQVLMMRELPDYKLYLVGFSDNQAYFERCQKAKEEFGLDNVVLMPNATVQERDDILNSSQFFLHTLVNEPFGITAVQGIAKGCIPLVHDSGGQVEVVPMCELRYSSLEEVPTLLQEVAKLDLSEAIAELQQNLHRFSSAEFRAAFKVVVLDKLEAE